MQLSTETIIWDGQAKTVAIIDRCYDQLERTKPQIVENGGSMPSILAEDCLEEIHEVCVRAASALELKRGTLKGDLVWTDDGPKVIEVAIRLSPTAMCGEIAYLSTGVNYVKEAIRISIGEEPHWDELVPKKRLYVASRYFWPPHGRLVAAHGVDELRAKPWCSSVQMTAKLGDRIERVESHADRAGYFVVTADTRAEMRDRIAEAQSMVTFEVERT